MCATWRGVERICCLKGYLEIKIANMMLYHSQAFQMFCNMVHFNATENLSNTFSSIFSVSIKDPLLKDIAYCVAKHQNLKHYSTITTREKPGIALTSFCLVWRSYNPMWVLPWFPCGWKQISTSNINVHKITHCSFLLPTSLFCLPLDTRPHTLPCPIYKQAANYLIPRKQILIPREQRFIFSF